MARSDHSPVQPVSQTSESAIDSILDQDLGCPGCGYNLRGLGGDRATCPECGLTSDVAKLLTRRWDKPWYKAPGYTRLCLPVAWIMIALLGWVVIWAVVDTISNNGFTTPSRTLWLSLFLLLTSGWSLLMTWAWRSMGGVVAAAYAVLAHVAMGAYLLGVPLVIGGVIAIIAQAVDLADQRTGRLGDSAMALSLSGVALAGGIGLLFLARWLERVIAGYCIRLYLRRPTIS